MSDKKCGRSEPVPAPETACFQPPEGSCEKKQDQCDKANNNKAEEPKLEPEPSKCRRMPKTDCSQVCSAPPPPKVKEDNDGDCGAPKEKEGTAPAPAPKEKDCDGGGAQVDPPRPDGSFLCKNSIPKTSACACGTGGSCCGPNTSCEVRPLKMKKKPITGKLPMP